jgi:hypothetical protein
LTYHRAHGVVHQCTRDKGSSCCNRKYCHPTKPTHDPILSDRRFGKCKQWELSIAGGATSSVVHYCNLARFRRGTTSSQSRRFRLLSDGGLPSLNLHLAGNAVHPHRKPSGTRTACWSPEGLTASTAALAQRMHVSGESASTIATTLGVSRATVYRVLAEQVDLGGRSPARSRGLTFAVAGCGLARQATSRGRSWPHRQHRSEWSVGGHCGVAAGNRSASLNAEANNGRSALVNALLLGTGGSDPGSVVRG